MQNIYFAWQKLKYGWCDFSQLINHSRQRINNQSWHFDIGILEQSSIEKQKFSWKNEILVI